MDQLALFHPKFDGVTYEESLDRERLEGQLERVRKIMGDRRWHTIPELAKRVGGSEAGVSARLRDLRKPKFGGHQVERERVAGGLFRYRVTI